MLTKTFRSLKVFALQCLGLAAFMLQAVAAEEITEIKTSGLSITFDAAGVPISVTNASGKELLDPDAQWVR